MLRYLPPAAALLALAACSPMAAPPQPVGVEGASPADRLVAAISAEGCTLTRDNVGAVLLRANLVQAEVPDLTNTLVAQGRLAVTPDNAIRVVGGACA